MISKSSTRSCSYPHRRQEPHQNRAQLVRQTPTLENLGETGSFNSARRGSPDPAETPDRRSPSRLSSSCVVEAPHQEPHQNRAQTVRQTPTMENLGETGSFNSARRGSPDPAETPDRRSPSRLSSSCVVEAPHQEPHQNRAQLVRQTPTLDRLSKIGIFITSGTSQACLHRRRSDSSKPSCQRTSEPTPSQGVGDSVPQPIPISLRRST
jgi:hypothetical protein